MPGTAGGYKGRMAKGNLVSTARELTEQSAAILAKANRARKDADMLLVAELPGVGSLRLHFRLAFGSIVWFSIHFDLHISHCSLYQYPA